VIRRSSGPPISLCLALGNLPSTYTR
jgi:hypothetical protein